MAKEAKGPKDPTTSAITDTFSALLDTGLAIGKAFAGDIAGAAADGTRAIVKLLPIIGSLLFILIFMLTFITASPAMIWDNIKAEYHEWTYAKCVNAIENVFDKSASDACENALDTLEFYMPDYETVRNSFFEDGQGGLGTLYLENGNTFSAQIDNTKPSEGKDVLLTYYNAATQEYTELRYVDGNNFANSPMNITYAEIINGFVAYRGKQTENKNQYVYSYDEEGNVIGAEVMKDNEGNPIQLQTEDIKSEVMGLTDYAALYYFINKSENSDQIYQIKYNVGADGTPLETINNNGAKKLANNEEMATKLSENGTPCKSYYQIVMSVETFDSTPKTSSNGRYPYSAFTQNLFDLTDEEMDVVAEKTAISNYIISTSLATIEDVPEDFSEYFTFSPAKKVFENIMGGKSVLQQMTDDGLIMGDFNATTCRNIIAAKALASRDVSVTFDNFFGIPSDDTFTKIFGEDKNSPNSHPGDPAMFATWVYYTALANDTISLRDGLFPSNDILKTTDDYYNFFKGERQYYTDLDNHHIEKGDMLFTKLSIDRLSVADGVTEGEWTKTEYLPYQVGIVTNVNKDLVTCVFYNFADDFHRELSVDDAFDKTEQWIYEQFLNNIGNHAYKTSVVTFNLGSDSNTTDINGNIIDYGKSVVDGYGKPDYSKFTNTYNIKYADKIEEMKKAQSTMNPNMGSGQFGFPCDSNSTITAGFPTYPSGKKHTGVDFSLKQGSNVYAAESGTVKTVRKLTTSYGYHIIIEHSGGVETLYGHNSELLVKVGDKVTKGQLIARSGNTGNSTGPHLHFEVRVNGKAVQPMNYIKK